MFQTQYFITFLDADGNELEEKPFPNFITREEAWDKIQADDRSVEEGGPWPAGATKVRAHARQVKAIYGVDYCPGSTELRFGGARVPRGAHQFRG